MPPDRPRKAARAQNPLTMSSGGEKWQRRECPARGGAAVGHPPRHPLPRKLRVPDAFCPQGRPWVLSASIRPDQPRVTRRIGARVGSARDPLPRQLADGGEFRRSSKRSPCPAPPPRQPARWRLRPPRTRSLDHSTVGQIRTFDEDSRSPAAGTFGPGVTLRGRRPRPDSRAPGRPCRPTGGSPSRSAPWRAPPPSPRLRTRS